MGGNGGGRGGGGGVHVLAVLGDVRGYIPRRVPRRVPAVGRRAEGGGVELLRVAVPRHAGGGARAPRRAVNPRSCCVGVAGDLAAPNTRADELALDFSTAYFARRPGALPRPPPGRAPLRGAPPRHALRARHLPRRAPQRLRAARHGGARRGHQPRAEPVDARRHARAGSPAAAAARAAVAPVLRRVHRHEGGARPAWFVRMVRFYYASDGGGGAGGGVAGVGAGVVDGGDRRRDRGERALGEQPVAGILQRKQKKREQQGAVTAFLHFC